MKHEDINKYLFDIPDSINAKQGFIKDTPDYKSFLASRLVRSGIERELQVIGEALNSALKIDASIPVSNIQKIKGTRNIIVHNYDGINYRIIWNIIIYHLSNLKKEVEEILNI